LSGLHRKENAPAFGGFQPGRRKKAGGGLSTTARKQEYRFISEDYRDFRNQPRNVLNQSGKLALSVIPGPRDAVTRESPAGKSAPSSRDARVKPEHDGG
jgi:hypothetical protein